MKKQSAEAMRLKARVANRARELGIPPIVALQNFMFERFLHRLSRSPYRENLVLKGGVLISQMFGLDQRTTMDIDTTAVSLALDNAVRCVGEICNLAVDDGIMFSVRGQDNIRKDDEYGGIRVKLAASMDRINVNFYIDVTTGDAITPAPTDYLFKSAFDDGITFLIKGYPVETIIAEKLETFLRLGVANTRPKDLYDLCRLKDRGFNGERLKEAFLHTVGHRKTEHIVGDAERRFAEVKASVEIAGQWREYQAAHDFAAQLPIEAVFDGIESLVKLIV